MLVSDRWSSVAIGGSEEGLKAAASEKAGGEMEHKAGNLEKTDPEFPRDLGEANGLEETVIGLDGPEGTEEFARDLGEAKGLE